MEAFLKIKNKFEVNCYENPFLFDIEKYMGKKREPSEKLFPKINKFIKFGEYFFTFYFVLPVENKNIEYNTILNALFLVNILFFGMGVIDIFGDELSEVGFIIGCISLSLLIILPLFIILMVYYCTNCCSHDSRIDFVYSKDFSKIFIGIVKYKENSYSKTFEYQMDEIERFFFQEPEIINGDIDLKVEYKDKRIAQIHRFKILYKFEQEGIEYILNIKRNKVNSDSGYSHHGEYKGINIMDDMILKLKNNLNLGQTQTMKQIDKDLDFFNSSNPIRFINKLNNDYPILFATSSYDS